MTNNPVSRNLTLLSALICSDPHTRTEHKADQANSWHISVRKPHMKVWYFRNVGRPRTQKLQCLHILQCIQSSVNISRKRLFLKGMSVKRVRCGVIHEITPCCTSLHANNKSTTLISSSRSLTHTLAQPHLLITLFCSPLFSFCTHLLNTVFLINLLFLSVWPSGFLFNSCQQWCDAIPFSLQ